MRFAFLLPLGAVLATLSAVHASPLYTIRAVAGDSNSTAGLPPTQDPFYTCPKGYASKAAGAILRQRFVQLNFTATAPENLKSAQQILYRTVDVFGKPDCTVSTVLQPFNQLKYPTRVLSYQFAEDSPALKCAPSYSLLSRASATTSSVELILVNLALSKGYVLLLPDYEGPKSGFTVGSLSATGVLDGLRAGLQIKSVIPDPEKAIVALYGYSGGALASGWAVQQAPVYAPELKIAGAVLGGHIINIKNILININNSTHSNLVVSGIAGQRNVFPALATYLKTAVFPNGTALLDDVNSKCLNDIFSDGTVFNFFDYIRVSEQEFFAAPAVVQALNSGILGAEDAPVPRVPLLVFNSVEDEIIVPNDVDDWVANICARGAPSVQHVKIASGQHAATAALGAPAAFNWIDARFQRLPVLKGCVTQKSISPLLDPLALLTTGQLVLNLLTQAAGGRIGPIIGF
ncbi:unnamed protein product [Tilletia controversa]|uniref:triacylglycerol lipase n=3 Tax=Tilletia TaxID=13289 RepID=A0A8X7T084_9BASI|nr:hypothetical protein CF336_g2847 [Tilletia laevis]KAE8202083.1 hypothetical protein CF328_g2423 [Tilletia controversa]KAE8262633.1 hypothetical protein A4X03_0g2307 [Tilletia caries]KAE8205997.1 hypothetical protein CF335_g2108 [Tilletia laevis]KAE8254412.1 hypothetical protein A4X06_0g913 [Tilletia controversa]